MSDNDNRRIFLGMPGYGKQTAGAGRAFWNASRLSGIHRWREDTREARMWQEYRRGSLLASNFNQLWCAALNLVNSGERLDYFAMLHDDISADDFWLDTLIAELEDKQLDVLSVAVPIKDTRGMTSMALHKQGDNWLPLCRLSMHDVYELPETFTSDDLPAPLLLNTGCWVVKWDQEWCKKVHFEINDRIVFNTAQNRYQSETEPEDWFFSRLCHELKRKLGATRKVSVLHEGEMEFSNAMPWGSDKYDREAVTKSPVPNAFPYDIPGWLFAEEGKKLAELAQGKRVLEFGSYCGRSTVCMARTAEHVTAVDYFDGRATPAPFDTLATFRESLKRYGVESKVEICHPEAEYPLPQYDFAFIDADHRVEAVRSDIIRACNVLSDDGVIAFHDYKNGIDPGVTVAVDEFLDRGGELITVCKTLAVVRPPASIPLEV